MIGTVPPPKVGHEGKGVSAGPYGPLVYLVVRHDGKMVGVEPERHDALAAITRLHDCDDYEIRPVAIGQIPLLDYK